MQGAAPPEPRESSSAARELLEQAEMVADEAKHVRRRATLLLHMAAELRSRAAEIVESQEDTTQNASTNTR